MFYSCFRCQRQLLFLLLLLITNIAHSAPPANKAIRPLAAEITRRLANDERIVVFFEDHTLLDPASEIEPAYQDVLLNLSDLIDFFQHEEKIVFRWLKVVHAPFSMAGGSTVAKIQAQILDNHYRHVFQERISSITPEGHATTEWVLLDDPKDVLRHFGIKHDGGKPEEVPAAAERLLKEEGARTAICLGYEGPEGGAIDTATTLLVNAKQQREAISVVVAPEFNIYRQQGGYSSEGNLGDTASGRRDRIKAEDAATTLVNDNPDLATRVQFSRKAVAEREAIGCRLVF